MNETLYIAFLIFVSVAASQGISLSYKCGTERMTDALSASPLMCTVASLFIALLYASLAFIFDGGIFFPDKISIFYGIALGAVYAIAAFFYLAALSCGPYTISVIILNLSSFMPTFYSAVFLGEKIKPIQIIGLFILILSCVVLTIARSRGASSEKTNIRWVIYSIITFFSNSFYTYIIRVNSLHAPQTPRNSFFTIAYLCSALICFIFFLATHGIKKRISPKPLILPAAGLALSIGTQLTPLAILPRFLSAAIQYPLEKGLGILVGVFIGIAFFKEKIGKTGWACIATMIATLFVISL